MSRNYVNRTGRSAGGTVSVNSAVRAQETINYDPTRREIAKPEKMKMELTGPLSLVMRIMCYFTSRRQ